ncbi:hypothetical protein H4219_002985 [Mycoemilia scoparia]|uniref:Uncharacterized protein n=1 Tax=Mycoemilia scoparia TaxID=417184 RepID=A0A9W8A1X8_9FUNG|nr:hypothetical protein H4219_002985 [Mycoemilia scoparia]
MGLLTNNRQTTHKSNIIWDKEGRPYTCIPLDLSLSHSYIALRHNGCCEVEGYSVQARPKNFLYRLFSKSKYPINRTKANAVCKCTDDATKNNLCTIHNPCYSCAHGHDTPPFMNLPHPIITEFPSNTSVEDVAANSQQAHAIVDVQSVAESEDVSIDETIMVTEQAEIDQSKELEKKWDTDHPCCKTSECLACHYIENHHNCQVSKKAIEQSA